MRGTFDPFRLLLISEACEYLEELCSLFVAEAA
jgi:hypothetical protein